MKVGNTDNLTVMKPITEDSGENYQTTEETPQGFNISASVGSAGKLKLGGKYHHSKVGLAAEINSTF